MTLLSLDTESCGLGLQYSLLTVTMAIADDQMKHQEVLDLKVKPNPIDGRTEFLVQPEALRVNKIDLAQHDLEAMTYDESKPIIYSWIQEMNKKYGTLTPFGQNVGRDIRLLTHYTVSEKSWHNFVDRRVLDTISIGKFAQLLGLIPVDQSLSLSKVCEYLKIEVDPNLIHTSLYDVELGTAYLKKLRELIGK